MVTLVARSPRYALTRSLRGLPSSLPVYQVSGESGALAHIGDISALAGNGYFFQSPEKNGYQEMFDGLPWFIQDMRPQGFIGRAFVRSHGEALSLPLDLSLWSDDDVLYAMARLGSDTSGNLIVGYEAAKQYEAAQNKTLLQIQHNSLKQYYDGLAVLAMGDSAPASSAAGEQPKFVARYQDGQKIRNVIVKFSPPYADAIGERWKDLLIAEHLALRVLGEQGGFDVPETRIIMSADRCYLESARFDRTEQGRLPVVSLSSIDHAFIGSGRSWRESATWLAGQNMLPNGTASRIRLLEMFGYLVGNTDMHQGNLSFYWEIRNKVPRFTLAPIYDMLPMLYAPIKNEIIERALQPGRVASVFAGQTDSGLLQEANALAQIFWRQVVGESDISEGFREIAAKNIQ